MAKKKPLSKDDLLNKFGENLKRLRLEQGLTGEELGKAAKMTKQNINRLESGATNPSLAVIQKISFALQIELKDLFTKMNL